MAGLLDFLQGASNSAAANVSAPIDGINWLLRKMGAPVSEKPFLGSDWMADKGLTAVPQNRNMGLLGEAVGGVLPMVAAAKAPQIAQGLLQAERNLAAPATLNKQAGVIIKNPTPFNVSHGSNDLFDEFKKGYGKTAEHIYTVPSSASNDAASYGKNLYTAQASPKKMIDFSDYESLDKQTLSALKKAAKDAGITDKYHTFDEFLQNAMDGQLYQAYGSQRTQNSLLNELFGKFDAVKMPDAGFGGAMSKSVVFENPSLLTILERNGQPIK